MRKKRNFFILFFVLLCFFVLLNIFTPVSNTIRGYSLSLISFAQKSFLEKGNNFSKYFEVFKDAKKVGIEIENLRKTNTNLNSKISSLLAIEEENKALRDILEVNLVEEEKFIFSQVVGRDISNNNIIVKHDKTVDVGLPVITPEGVLIGVVEKIHGDGYASIELLTSINSALEVKVQNEDLPIGILKGSGEKELHIDLLPKDKLLGVGDYVVAIPNSKGIKKELYVGRISKIEETDIKAFKKALIWQGIDYRYLNYLFIVY
jgi:rod shape-determining protein MreC